MILTFFVIVLLLIVIGLILMKMYTVVEPNEAHIVVFMGKGRKVYTPHVDKTGDKVSTAYFFIPFLMKRIILPLSNVKMEIPSFELNDTKMAPFTCEVTCWFCIEKPDIAVEKLNIQTGAFGDVIRDVLEEQVRGIARAAAMKQEILEIMRDRKTFGDGVVNEVNGALEAWGLEIVKLEIVGFSDSEGSTVIKDYEDKRKSQIRADSRKEIANQNKDAQIVEAQALKESGIAKTESNREIEKAVVEKEKQVKMAVQDAEAEVAKKEEEANVQKVEAHRKITVGKASVEKEATVEKATGEAEATLKKGRAEADVVEAKGTAEATVTEKKGLAEAIAKDKMAEALKKFNEAGITLEQLRAWIEVQKSKYENFAKALSNADINIVSGDKGGNILGFDMNAEAGAGLAQMLKAFEKITGKNVKAVVKDVISNVIEKKKEE